MGPGVPAHEPSSDGAANWDTGFLGRLVTIYHVNMLRQVCVAVVYFLLGVACLNLAIHPG